MKQNESNPLKFGNEALDRDFEQFAKRVEKACKRTSQEYLWTVDRVDGKGLAVSIVFPKVKTPQEAYLENEERTRAEKALEEALKTKADPSFYTEPQQPVGYGAAE